MNSLLSKINNCPKESVNSYITEAIALSNFNSTNSEMYGFSDNQGIFFIHDFIPLSSRFKYSISSSNSYSLESTDYFYEFAKYIKSKNISEEEQFIKELYSFLGIYFGKLDLNDDRRDEYFDTFAFQMSSTDQEYYENLEKVKIGDFKGKNIALGSERAIVAHNIMSLFGIDCYLCVGILEFLENKREHCFNVVDGGECVTFIDYSIPCYTLNGDEIIDSNPFFGKIISAEFEEFLSGGYVVSFKDYVNVYSGDEYYKKPTGSSRSYSLCDKKIFANSNRELS